MSTSLTLNLYVETPYLWQLVPTANGFAWAECVELEDVAKVPTPSSKHWEYNDFLEARGRRDELNGCSKCIMPSWAHDKFYKVVECNDINAVFVRGGKNKSGVVAHARSSSYHLRCTFLIHEVVECCMVCNCCSCDVVGAGACRRIQHGHGA